MANMENIKKITDGYTFMFISEGIIEGEFECICHGNGKNAYLLKRNDGLEIKVGKDCLKYCGLELPQKSQHMASNSK